MTEKLKIILLILGGTLFAYILFQSYHYDNIFKVFFYLIIGLIWFYIFYKATFNDLVNFNKTKELKSFSSTFVGIFMIILNLGIFSFYEYKINRKSLLKTEYGNIIADFKVDKNYIIEVGSWASKEHFYGTYSISQSIITLDENLKLRKYLLKKLKIKKNGNESFLSEIGKNEIEVGTSELRIIEDNRK